MPPKRRSYTADFKLQVVKYAAEKGNRPAEREFGVSEKLVRDWCKAEATLISMKKTKRANRGLKARWPELEQRVHTWVLGQKAAEQRCQEVTDSQAKMDSFRAFIEKEVAAHDVSSDHIIHMQEVPLTFDLPMSQKSVVTHEKWIFTVVLACCGDGSKLPPMGIFKQKTTPKADLSSSIVVTANEKGCMNEETMNLWLAKCYCKRPDGFFKTHKALLVMDSMRGAHISEQSKATMKACNSIAAVIPADLTEFLQPLHASVSRSFTAVFRGSRGMSEQIQPGGDVAGGGVTGGGVAGGGVTGGGVTGGGVTGGGVTGGGVTGGVTDGGVAGGGETGGGVTGGVAGGGETGGGETGGGVTGGGVTGGGVTGGVAGGGVAGGGVAGGVTGGGVAGGGVIGGGVAGGGVAGGGVAGGVTGGGVAGGGVIGGGVAGGGVAGGVAGGGVAGGGVAGGGVAGGGVTGGGVTGGGVAGGGVAGGGVAGGDVAGGGVTGGGVTGGGVAAGGVTGGGVAGGGVAGGDVAGGGVTGGGVTGGAVAGGGVAGGGVAGGGVAGGAVAGGAVAGGGVAGGGVAGGGVAGGGVAGGDVAGGGVVAHLQCPFCGLFSNSHAHQLIHVAAMHPGKLEGFSVGRLGNILIYQRTAKLFHCGECFHTCRDFSKLYQHLVSKHCLDQEQEAQGAQGAQEAQEAQEERDEEMKEEMKEEVKEEEEEEDGEKEEEKESSSLLTERGGRGGHRCLICGWRTKHRGLAISHVVRKHDIPKAYASQGVKYAAPPLRGEEGEFMREELMKEEIEATNKVVGMISNRYVCLLCGWKTKRKGFAISHVVRSHDVERPYSCRSCDRSFFLPSRLQQHVSASHRLGRFRINTSTGRGYSGGSFV
ncbi:Pogo transposable element with KRAB domain [Dissostichus eleginoides]|uniref:Pogo transposable element with KRAB domain n=1 Tax=Dissostichus eleginoides TaxID=100907 RepID=A0AAD9B686_DISEL|nr:Pogo transposable element with KRAB domain [Dissostichus eleginoides]